jgi:hypothetical protein
MKSLFRLVFLCVLIINIMSTHLGAQSPLYFTKTYYASEAKSMIEVNDATEGTCYVIAGGGGDCFLMKVNSYGDTLWTRWYGGPAYEIINSVKQTADGGYILVGTTMSYVSGGVNAFMVIKTDAFGDTLWSRSYQGSCSGAQNSSEGFDAEVLADGYLLVGKSWAFQPSYYGSLVIRLNLNGDTLWSKIYKLGGGAISVKKTSDGGFAIAQTWSSADFSLFKIDSIGTLLWHYRYGGPNGEWATQMIETSTGYLIVGRQDSSSGSVFVRKGLIMKIDFSGNHQWSRIIEIDTQLYQFINGVAEDEDGGFIFTGQRTDSPNSYARMFFGKIDSTGNLCWGNVVSDTTNSISSGKNILPSSGGYLVSGIIRGILGFLKIDTLGFASCNNQAVQMTSIPMSTTTISFLGPDSLVTPVINYPNLGIFYGSSITTLCAIYPPVPIVKDIKVEKILSPATPLLAGTNLYPSFRVKNIGTDTVTSFDFFYSYTGEITGTQISPVTKFSIMEVWNGTLLPNQQIDLTFNEPLSISAGFADFCTFVELVDDIDTSNNSLCLAVEGTTIGIDQPTSDPPNNIFPNPSHGEITVVGEGEMNLIIYNLAGAEVFQQKVKNSDKIFLSIPSGVYLYSLGIKKGKLLIQ